MTKTKNTCPDCGPAPVPHWAFYIMSVVDWFLLPPINFLQNIEYHFTPAIHTVTKHLGIFFVKLAVVLHLGTLTKDLDEKDNLRTDVLWKAAKERGIRMEEFRFLGRPESSFFIVYHNNDRMFFDGLPMPKGASLKSLGWIDDKGKIQKVFQKAGIPVARGGTAVTFAQAEKLFQEIKGMVIVKPRRGSRSRHTFVNISTLEELKPAFRSAQKLSPWVLVQEQLIGPVYRGTVINGKVVGVIRRDEPFVIGDGVSTISQLIEKENKDPRRQGPIFYPLVLNAETDHELARQHYTRESIPASGQQVRVNPKVSRGVGATTTDVTNNTHPDNIAMLEYAAKILNSSLVGIDFIIEDISKSWKMQKRSGIIECNAVPYIDLHHYPFNGQPRDVAGYLWEQVFPDLQASHSTTL